MRMPDLCISKLARPKRSKLVIWCESNITLRNAAHARRFFRVAWFAALLGGMIGSNVSATEVVEPLKPSLEVGVEKSPEPFMFPFKYGLSATGSSLLVRNFANGGLSLIRPKGDGTWQIASLPGTGRISATSAGFLLTESGTAHVINADLSRSHLTSSKLTLLDEATGAQRWTAQWEGRTAESPVLIEDRVYVYTRESNVGTAFLGLDSAGKEVKRIKLPFEWNVSAGVLIHGHEIFFHGLSSYGPFIVAYDPATGREIWRETLGFGSTMSGVSGALAVLHYPFDDGPYAVVDLATHKVLKKGTTKGLLDRSMAVANGEACFWGKKVDGETSILQCLDLKTLNAQWKRSFDSGTFMVAGIVHQDGRFWILVQPPQGATHLLALDPATGATVRDLPLDERLSLDPSERATSFEGLLVVGTKGGRVLGYPLPRD
jgi:outer membrane protein assembly factor BamB